MNNIQELTKQIDELKGQLRQARLLNAPEPFTDYKFEVEGGSTTLSQLFGDSPDLLIWHNMGLSCNYCTLWADGLAGFFKQIESRCPIVLVSPDQVAVQKRVASARNWQFRMVRDADKAFSKATGFYTEEGGMPGFWPGLSAFHKDENGSIVRTNFTVFGPGDDFCPVWPCLELLKGGIAGWEPEEVNTESLSALAH